MSKKVVLCTGAIQGLGFAVLQVAGCVSQPTPISFAVAISTAGKQAVQKLKDLGVTAKVDLVRLDVTDDQQITAVVDHVTNTYGRLDGKATKSHGFPDTD